MKKFFSVWSALALIAMATACAKSSSPTQPSDSTQLSNGAASTTSSAGAVVSTPEGATISSPAPVTPSNNEQIKFASQPITLTVKNGITTGSGTMTYTFEVATDSGFTSIKQTKSVAAGSGQTSVALDKLAGATTYYWRSRIQLNSSNGPNSPVRSFTVGPEVVLQAPVLATPGSNATVGDQPTLTVNAVGRSGPAGTIAYTFQVSQASDFSAIADTGTVTEQPNSVATSYNVATSLSDRTTYWWRVQATDTTNNVTSPWSNANPFFVQKFDIRNAIIYDNPPNTASFRETAKITYVDTAGPYIVVDFDRRTGPNAWREVSSSNFGPLQYTLGACFNIDGQWYCSAPIQFWYGRELEAGGPTWQMAQNWYYDPVRWGRMSGHQPVPGETVGFWVGQGNLRGGNGSYDEERSNVQLVQWGTTWSASALQRLPFSKTSIFNMLQPHK